MYKKYFSIFLSITIFMSFFFPITTIAFANNDEIRALNLSSDDISTEYMGLDISKGNVKDISNKLQDINSNFDAVLIPISNLKNTDRDAVNQLMDNGLSVMIYGENLDEDNIRNFIGDTVGIKNEKSKTNKNDKTVNSSPQLNITLVSISNISGQYVYNEVVDASNFTFTTSNGAIMTAQEISNHEKSLSNSINKSQYKHDPLYFVKEVLKSNKEIQNINIQKEVPTNIVTTQAPAAPTRDPVVRQYDYSDLAYLTTTMYPYLVYTSSTTHYWDFVNSVNVQPKSFRYVDYYKTTLNNSFVGQTLIDYTYMPSNTYSASVSLNSSGVVNATYGVSTQEQEISHSGTNYEKTWQSNIIPNQSIWYPGYSPNMGPYKLEPGIRITNTAGAVYVSAEVILSIASNITGIRYTSSPYTQEYHWGDF